MAERTSPTGRNLPAFHCQLLIALVLLCSVMGCRGNHNAAAEQEEAVDLQQIKDQA
jgi:membrane-bound lytic murein transglycosylase F